MNKVVSESSGMDKTRRFLSPQALFIVGGLILWLVVALLGYRLLGLAQARRLTDFGAAPAFQLTDHLERPVSSDEFRGKVVVANFVYTHCRDICPLLSVRMQALQECFAELGGFRGWRNTAGNNRAVERAPGAVSRADVAGLDHMSVAAGTRAATQPHANSTGRVTQRA